MKQLPFTIQKIIFGPDSRANIVEMDDVSGVEGQVPGYFVMSSAPPNIEEASEASEVNQRRAALGINSIASYLHRMMAADPDHRAELVITVHGYNTSRDGVETWYKNIFNYLNRHDAAIAAHPSQVFIGYRWPSENVALRNPKKIIEAFQALPPLPRDLLMTGGLCAIVLLVFELLAFGESIWGFMLSLFLTLLFVLGTLMLALVVLRLVVYFRDSYRADNFGVLDLVELLRQIDQAIVKLTAEEMFPNSAGGDKYLYAMGQARDYWGRRSQHKVRLSFIGHSMGGFVVTNVVRILSDVFDTDSVDKRPDNNIGDVFCLGRLILASPDIPVLTIISSRANFLASSLRRFSESYLFSSEGDIALRTASTTANYIAFPSKTQARGYRLGNVALQNKQGDIGDYGLINLRSLDRDFSPSLPIGEAIAQTNNSVMENLFLTYQRFQKRGVVTLADLFQNQSARKSDRATVADFFTYFDCTDYIDVKYDPSTDIQSEQPTGILTRALGHATLKPWDYALLTLDYALGKRDVHGGYFEGQFSQVLMYRLAFLGFEGYLHSLNDDTQVALSQLHLTCQEKQIQGFLSPVCYRVCIQGGSLEGTKAELFKAIESNS
ncbi:alpha/beta hydrolase [Nodosilinea sp. LEGE 07088]|uniref:alpha/beta hydrolase n=1 Tax=Nodosilinea sp. LEGE 07088 TaxID=2777968 RepID=UPI0018801EC4|nr:alpha/beta hydrolase [Nodosilinea sp. LEGE 07088]MBE9140282.1 alpha/beta hydrolase [Nodosilinea sp. LEGE 07088]